MNDNFCERHPLHWIDGIAGVCPVCRAVEVMAKLLLPHILAMEQADTSAMNSNPVPMNPGPTPVPTSAGTAPSTPATAPGAITGEGWQDGRRPDHIDHCGGCRLRMLNGRVRWENGQIIGFLCHACAKKEGFGA